MSNEKNLMNPATGSVDTESNWLAEKENWGPTADEQFDSLVGVERDTDGHWVEVK